MPTVRLIQETGTSFMSYPASSGLRPVSMFAAKCGCLDVEGLQDVGAIELQVVRHVAHVAEQNVSFTSRWKARLQRILKNG